MEEKHEGTPNPLNPSLEHDAPGVEQAESEGQANTSVGGQLEPGEPAIADTARTEPEEGGFVPPVELFGSEPKQEEKPGPESKPEEKPEPEYKPEPEPKPEEKPEPEHKPEPEPKTEGGPRKISITEPEATPGDEAPKEDIKVGPIVEPTSEESAYQPSQEVKTPVKPKEKSFDIPKDTPEPEDDGFLSMRGPESAKPAQAMSTARPAHTIDMVRPAAPAKQAAGLDSSPSMDALGMAAGSFVSSQANLDPTNRPMEKAAVVEAPKRKKKNTGLIIAMIVSLFVAVGCGVAAALIAMSNDKKEDVVAVAASQLINGEAPANIAVDGTISFDVAGMDSDISDVILTLKSEAVRSSLINSTSATLDVEYRNGDEVELQLGEIYAANGDLYLKVSGLNSAITDAASKTEMNCTESETNCITMEEVACAEDDADCVAAETTDETSGEMAELLAVLGSLNMIDGEWIRVPVDTLNTLAPDGTQGNGLICAAQFISGFNTNSNSFAGIYNQHPFIASTDENLTVPAREDPIHLLLIDGGEFNSFVSDAQNLTAMKDLASCLGHKDAKIDSDDMTEAMEELPAIYVEVDENYNFTRLYFEKEIVIEDDCCPEGAQCIAACDDTKQGKMKVTVDLNFDYPTNVNVPEPTEYRDLNDIIQQISSELFGADVVEETPVEAQ